MLFYKKLFAARQRADFGAFAPRALNIAIQSHVVNTEPEFALGCEVSALLYCDFVIPYELGMDGFGEFFLASDVRDFSGQENNVAFILDDHLKILLNFLKLFI